jgi:hypothetical protein
MSLAPTLEFDRAVALPAEFISSYVDWVEDYVVAIEEALASMVKSMYVS